MQIMPAIWRKRILKSRIIRYSKIASEKFASFAKLKFQALVCAMYTNNIFCFCEKSVDFLQNSYIL